MVTQVSTFVTVLAVHVSVITQEQVDITNEQTSRTSGFFIAFVVVHRAYDKGKEIRFRIKANAVSLHELQD